MALVGGACGWWCVTEGTWDRDSSKLEDWMPGFSAIGNSNASRFKALTWSFRWKWDLDIQQEFEARGIAIVITIYTRHTTIRT